MPFIYALDEQFYFAMHCLYLLSECTKRLSYQTVFSTRLLIANLVGVDDS